MRVVLFHCHMTADITTVLSSTNPRTGNFHIMGYEITKCPVYFGDSSASIKLNGLDFPAFIQSYYRHWIHWFSCDPISRWFGLEFLICSMASSGLLIWGHIILRYPHDTIWLHGVLSHWDSYLIACATSTFRETCEQPASFPAFNFLSSHFYSIALKFINNMFKADT